MNQSNQKTLIASAVAFAILTLTGCGDSTSSNHASLIAPPANTKTIISIGNETNQTFARAILLDQNGNSIKTQEIDCRPAATGCMMYLPSEVQQATTLIFQDKQGHMVGAFRFPNKLQSYNAAYPNSLTTGIYLTNRLVRDYLLKDGVSWPDARQKLEVFFKDYDSPDGSADLFEELGDYYAKRMATTPTSENEFLETLKKRLMAGDVAKPEELPTKTKKQSGLDVGNKLANAYNQFRTGNISLISAAHAQQPSEGCPSAVQYYLSWVNNMGGTIPVVGDAVAGVAGFAGELCAPDTNAKLDKMLSKLTALQTSVDQIATSLGVLKDFTEDAAINNETVTFQRIEENARTDVTRYKDFLVKNKVNSLEEYIKDWDTAIAGNDELLKILKAPNTTLAGMKGLTKKATFNTYTTALNNRCSVLQQGRAGVNFVNIRQACNNNIVYNTALLAGTQQLMSPMLTDIYKVLAKFNNKDGSNKVYNKIGMPAGIVSDYNQAATQIKTFYNNELNDLVKKFQADVGHDKKGFFNLYKELNAKLQASLVARDCNGRVGDRKKFPAISGWYLPTSDENDNYIVTECMMITIPESLANKPSGWPTSSLVKARYFYGNQGNGVDQNDVGNVLGVPVAMHYVTSHHFYSQKKGAEKDIGNKAFEAPYLVAFNNKGDTGQPTSHTPKGVIPNIQLQNADSVLTKAPDQSGYYRVITPKSSFFGHTWLSFKDRQEFRYVTLLLTDGGGSQPLNGELACVTSDCSAAEWLTFRIPDGSKDGSKFTVDLSPRPSGRIQLGPLQLQ